MDIRTLHYAPLDVCLGMEMPSSGSRTTVVQVRGDIDEPAVPAFTDGLVAGIDEAERSVIVDLTHVRFLGIAGARVLADEQVYADGSGLEMLLVPGGRSVLRSLTVTGLLERFARFASVEAAVDEMRVPLRQVG